MPNWLTGRELLQRWQIQHFQLLEHITIGLQPHDQFGKPKPSPDVIAKRQNMKMLEEELKKASVPETVWVDFEWEEDGYNKEITARECQPELYDHMEEEIRNLRKELEDAPVDWRDYELPENEEDILSIFDDLERSLFSVKDVEEYEKAKDLVVGGDLSAAQTGPSSMKSASYQKSFLRQGEYWEVTFEGIKAHLKHRESLHYVINLLKNQNREIHVVELVRLAQANYIDYIPSKKVPKHGDHYDNDEDNDAYDHDELPNKELSVDKLTCEEINRFREIGTKLLTELDIATTSNNAAMVTKKSDEFNKYKNYLLKEYGLMVRQSGTSVVIKQGFHPRSPELERARKLAYKHIADARKAIGKVIPSLEVYLNNHIDTGEYCKYRSDAPEWRIES